MLNKVFIMGRLGADPELRRTQSGIPVASFRLAVDRDFKDKQTGERATDWIDVTAWRQTGIMPRWPVSRTFPPAGSTRRSSRGSIFSTGSTA